MRIAMTGMFGKALAISAAFFVLCAALTCTAYAGNGTRMLGFSARDSAMGGATTASAVDTSCLVKNPAGLVKIGNRVDVEYLSIMPHDVTIKTEGPTSSPGLPMPAINREMKQTSNINYIPGIDTGISYRLPGTDAHPISVGVGAFTMAGVALNYPSSRLNSALTGNYDKMVDLRSMRIAPGIAVAFTDKFSFGATTNIAIQGLRANLATPSLAETSGGGNWSFVPGLGFTLGFLYEFNDMLSLGAAYESHGWMQHHHLYKDVLPFVDEPPVISLGLSLKPVKNVELTYDTRYINWTNVKLARIKPVDGGFGWQDQWVFAVGGEFTTFKDRLKLRMGYNYGKSPIQPSVVFANSLLPVIMEHHLTTGFSYFLMKNLSMDLTWEHHFTGVKVDNGAGDIYSIRGAGTKITSSAEVISAGMGYRF